MGKSGSKLNKTKSQSMAWSFRFASQRKKRKVIINETINIHDWLQRLNLSEYEDNFKYFEAVEELLSYKEIDFIQLGINNSSHRSRIIASLSALVENFSKPISQRSTTFSNITEVNHGEIDLLYEELGVKKQDHSKSLCDIINMECSSPLLESSQDALALKKALEWELALDSRDLRSHAWYHGPISRQRAEEILKIEGDFIVRDCVSQPGNYVLSCKGKHQILHFVINKLVLQPETVYERIQYQFEDEPFDTVPDLITFYVGSGKAISAASGARIQSPCNRLCPLSYYASKFGIPYSSSNSSLGSGLTSPLPSSASRFNQTNTYRSPMSSPPRTKRDIPPRLPSKKQRSQSLTPSQSQIQRTLTSDNHNSGDGVIRNGDLTSYKTNIMQLENCTNTDAILKNSDENHEPNIQLKMTVDQNQHSADGVINGNHFNAKATGNIVKDLRFTSNSLPRNQITNNGRQIPPRASSLSRDTSNSSINKNEEIPPPKPVKDRGKDDPVHRVASYHASGSDSGNGSGDSAQSLPTGEEILQNRCGVIIKNPRFMQNSMSSITLKSFADIDPIAAEETLRSMEIPYIEQMSNFDVDNFHTVLLPCSDFKPLDSGTLTTFRMMISETSPRIIALTITRVDIKLILGNLEDLKHKNPLEITGLEKIMFEHGKQFRRDLIERTQCLKLLVAVTILTCPTDEERAEILNKWIQIAIDAKTSVGNLFAFSTIMLGLCMPQIQKLEGTWYLLRQKFTDSAFNFEAKLRPILKSMNDCSNPQAPNTTIPHILPYILIKDRTIDDLLDASIPQSSLIKACITPLETTTQDFGFGILFLHLDAARGFGNNLPLYRQNAKIVMSEHSRVDTLLEEAFRTEFHIKFLWGSKGALAPTEERHTKFEQVLGMMADKLSIKHESDIPIQ
ncbi:breast cancer anti-estrogen resistance protein 3 homolog [Chironomus tepperi]|uniref:breast cancer anti-estrogen resistance protein 3 homolog n=1 Tax=Chironomus tepperi TaxID=113505 RepID=UPI00391F050A